MAAPKRELSEIKLDHMAGKAASANEARQEAARLLAFADELDREIKDAMGEAEQATIFGVPYFTYTWKDSYALKRFEDDHPHIARNYKVPVTKDVLDKDKLLAEQGDILRQYQTREFRRVNRNPGT